MRHLLLASAFVLATTAAHAGSERPQAPLPGATQSQTAQAVAGARSASLSHSTSHATGGTSNVTLNSTTRGGGSGRNAPDVLIGGISGGHACGLSAGVGGSGPGAGGLLQWMWAADGCEIRQKAALMATLMGPDAGFSVLCEDPWVADAMANRIPPTPCPKDERRWRKEGWRP